MQKERDLRIHFVVDFVENDPLRYFVGGSLKKTKEKLRLNTLPSKITEVFLDGQQYKEYDTIT